MIGAYPALVTAVLPQRHGVMVVFPDGVYYPEGDLQDSFVRVLASRAHPQGGARVELPQKGELGIVLQVDADLAIWLGGLHPQSKSQVPSDEFLSLWRHESGVCSHTHANGDTQWEHPSGTKVRVSEGEDDLPRPQGTSVPIENVTSAPWISLAHPKAGKLTVSPEGDVVLDHPGVGKLSLLADGTLSLEHSSGGLLQADSGGTLEMKEWSEVKFQDAGSRFCMEDLFTWAKTHTHLGVISGPSVSGKPVIPPPDSSLSPSTFKGPKGP